ncbi:hypothetical protein DdX_16660 [Ditylenchus destructor]|uniref:Uncharacterized protein n=1 Tax=Ditylenchus destructor TaxID=166010 RepID=A0AAD4QZR0_9BILA|nr:hypothetical protein DdX_16660 [Ditylenchus destructor]
MFCSCINAGAVCKTTVEVTSRTNQSFNFDIVPPDGNSVRLTFMEDGQKQTFTLKMEDGCGCNRLWLMTVIDSNGTQKGSEEANLTGMSRVVYEVGKELWPVQVEVEVSTCQLKWVEPDFVDSTGQ